MTDHQFEFLPFHAINEFMRNDYRLSVVRTTLTALPELPPTYRETLDRLTRKYVKVPGFRNSEKAPLLVRAIPLAKSFEKSPELVAGVLAAWTEHKASLRQQIFDLLKERNWKMFPSDLKIEDLSPDKLREWAVLPLEVDRRMLSGFYTHWPKGEDFEAIYKNFTEKYPDVDEGIDNVSLMVVWLTMRLPITQEGGEEQPADEEKVETESDSN